MFDVDDITLLREYADGHSDSAFAGIVHRHINLVYSVALRYVGNSSDAQDVTQAVFIILTQKAASLRHRTTLTGWLYEATRFTAMNFLTGKTRRQAREQKACLQAALDDSNSEEVWHQLAPLLEAAMTRLSEKERTLVALRFFENKTPAETAALLGINEWTARKRVERVLEKLRASFSKHGVNSTAAAIAGAISANSVQAAPAGLAQIISSVAVAKSAAASASTLTLLKGALKIMAWSKTKTTIIAVVVALLGVGGTTLVVDALLPVPDIQGTWEGTLNIPAPGWGVHQGEMPKMLVVMRIAKVNGAYQAAFDNIGRGYHDIKFDQFTYQYPYAHAQVTTNGDQLSCVGKVNRSGGRMSWNCRENQQAYAMVFRRTTNPTPFPEALTDAEYVPRAGSELQGFWVGKIGRGNKALRIQIKIAERSRGTFRADFYVPDQNTNRQPTAVSYDGTTVRLVPMNGYGMFEGRLRTGGGEMTGNWIQDGRLSPTILTQANY